MPDVTQILSQIEQGDAAAADQLLPLVHDDLRRLAAARLAQEKLGHLRRTDAVQQTKKQHAFDTDLRQLLSNRLI